MREDLLLKLSILTVYQHRVPVGGGGSKEGCVINLVKYFKL